MKTITLDEIYQRNADIVSWATLNEKGVRCPLQVATSTRQKSDGNYEFAYQVGRNNGGVWELVCETGWNLASTWDRLDPVKSIIAGLLAANFSTRRAVALSPKKPAPTGLRIVVERERNTAGGGYRYTATANYLGAVGWSVVATCPASLANEIDKAWGVNAHFAFSHEAETTSFHGLDRGRLIQLIDAHWGNSDAA